MFKRLRTSLSTWIPGVGSGADDIEFDGEPLSLSDGVAHKDEKRSRFEWKRHGHNFALEERLDVPKRTEAARRFCLSIDGTPFQVGDGGCARAPWPS